MASGLLRLGSALSAAVSRNMKVLHTNALRVDAKSSLSSCSPLESVKGITAFGTTTRHARCSMQSLALRVIGTPQQDPFSGGLARSLSGLLYHREELTHTFARVTMGQHIGWPHHEIGGALVYIH